MDRVQLISRKGLLVLIIICLLGSPVALVYYQPVLISQWSNIKWSLGGYGWELAVQSDGPFHALSSKSTKALLVVKDGKIAYEWYGNKINPNTRYGTASLSKSLVGSMSLLIALNDELIHIDDPAWKYIKKWESEPLKSKITIRHLATHSSGIPHARQSSDRVNEWEQAFWERTPDPISPVLSEAPVVCMPGKCYIYSGPAFAALSYAVTNSLRKVEQLDILKLLEKRVMKPLGIPGSDWSISYGESYRVDGMTLYATWGGASFTARSAARIGQLMLNLGKWDDKVISKPVYVKIVTSYGNKPLPKGLTKNPLPTPGWWSNANCVWPSLPRDAFVGAGAGHEILLIVPSLNLVVVRFGSKYGSDHWGGDYWNALELNLFKPMMKSLSISDNAC